jgi:hypothetical protein
VIAVVLVVALSVSGCGQSVTTSAAPPTIAAASARHSFAGGRSLSTDENHLCSVLVDNLSKLPSLALSPASNSGQAFARSYRLEVHYLARFVTGLRALRPPNAEAAKFASFVEGNEYALGVFRRLLPYILSNHLKQAVPLMRRGAIADSELRVLARELNLSACATGQAHSG